MNKVGTSHSPKGFTIVELLIAIVIIGILAALVVVAFNGVQGRSYDASVQNDLRNFANKVKMFEADKGRLPVNDTEFASMGVAIKRNVYHPSSNPIPYCSIHSGENMKFSIGGSSRSGNGFYYSSTEGLKSREGWGTVGNVAFCPTIGVDSSDPNYFHRWIMTGANTVTSGLGVTAY